MPINRYVATAFLANLLLLAGFFYSVRDPASNPEWLWRLVVGAPIMAAYISWTIWKQAKQVAPDARTSFWSYKAANLIWVGWWTLFAVAASAVLLGWRS